MYSLIHKYFAIHNQIALPEFGSFHIVNNTAILDDENLLHAPTSNVVFNSEPTLVADKKLYHFLMHELNVEEIEAIKKLHEFICEIKKNASEGNEIDFTGIGKIVMNANGSFKFQQKKNTFNYTPIIQISKIHNSIVDNYFNDSKNSDSIENKKDKSWIFVIVLAMIAFAAILIKLNID